MSIPIDEISATLESQSNDAPTTDAVESAGPRAWRINMRLAVVTLVVLGIGSVSLFLWHRLQIRRNAAAILVRGRALSQQGQWRAASGAFHQYLQLRPEDPEALLALAENVDKSFTDADHRPHIVTLYFQAVRANPGKPKTRLRLAELLLETGRLEEAGQQAEEVAAALPDDVEPVRILARVLKARLGPTRKPSASEVVEFYRQALSRHPGDIILSTGLADVLRKFRDALPADERDSAAGTADETIDEMVSQHPGDCEVLLARYRYRTAYSLPGGLDDLESARQTAPDNPDVLLASVVALCDSDPGLARELGERLLDVAPGSRRAYLTVASLYSRLNQPEEAIRVLEAAAERLGRDDLEIQRGMMQLFLGQQDSDRAKSALAQLESLLHRYESQLPNLARRRIADELEFARVQLQCLAGNTEAALPALKRLTATVTESADALATLAERQRRWKLLAAVYAKEGMHDRAAAACDQLVRLDPRSNDSQLLAAVEWQRIGDVDRAAHHFELATTGDSATPAAWLGLAEMRLQQQLRKAPASARDWSGFDTALKIIESTQPDAPAALLLRATASLVRNDRAGALQVMRKLSSQPGLDTALLPRLAVLLQDAGAQSESNMMLERFRSSGGNAETAELVTAELHRRRGKFEEAGRTLEQALDRAPESSRSLILQQLIAAEIDAGAIQSARQRLQGLRRAKFKDLWVYQTAADLAIMAGDPKDLADCVSEVEKIEGSDGTLWRFLKSLQRLESEQDSNDGIHQANRWAAEIETARPAWPQLQVLRGRIADRLGRAADAVEAYEQALRSGARSLAVYQWLISDLQQLNRFAEISQFLGTAGQMAAVSDGLAAEAIPASLRAGNADAALRIARTAAELRPTDAAAQIWYSQTLAQVGKTEAAETLLRSVLQRAPQEPRGWSALVWILHSANRPAEARQALDEMVARVSLNPHEREIVLARGFELLGDLPAAERSYRQALAGHEQDSQLWQEVGRFYLRTDHDQALAAFQQALKLNPKLVEARRTAAWLLAMRGADAESSGALAALNETDAASVIDDNRLQATLLIAQGGAANLQKAAHLLVDLVSRNDQAQAGDRLLLARAYELLNRSRDARRQFEAALRTNDSSAFRSQFLQFLIRQKQFDEALALALQKLDGADLARDASTIARILTFAASSSSHEPSRLADAEKVFSAARKSLPGNVLLLLELGTLRMMQGRNGEAIGLFEEALAKAPKSPAVLNNLALALAESPDRRNEALRIIDRALALLPDSPELLDSKSLILISAGRVREAREILESLCKAQDKNPRFRLHLAMALFPLKDEASSRSHITQAVDDGLERELLTPFERRAWRQITSQVAGVTSK